MLREFQLRQKKTKSGNFIIWFYSTYICW